MPIMEASLSTNQSSSPIVSGDYYDRAFLLPEAGCHLEGEGRSAHQQQYGHDSSIVDRRLRDRSNSSGHAGDARTQTANGGGHAELRVKADRRVEGAPLGRQTTHFPFP